MHEVMSEFVESRGVRVHETMSEFVESKGVRAHETESEFVKSREMSAHEIKSEFVESKGVRAHETESEFAESRGMSAHEIKSEFVGLREAFFLSLPARLPSNSRGEGGDISSSGEKKRRCPEKKKVSGASVGYFRIKTDFDVVCFQKVSRPIPL